MKRSLTQIFSFITTISRMINIIWQVHPLYFAVLFLIEILYGLMPLAAAWINKTLFDLLAKSFQIKSFEQSSQSLLILLIAVVFLSVASQLIIPFSGYLNAELGRRLTLNIRTSIYEKINSLQGLAPFETSRFHNTLQLAMQGAQFGPTQMLNILTILTRGFVTLISIIGVLTAFSPLLAGLVILTALPQLYVQIKMGKQRFGMTFQNSPKDRLASYYGHILSAPQFIKEVRLFNLGEYFLKSFQRVIRDVQHTQRNQQIEEIRWQSGSSLLTSLVSGGVFVAIVLRAFSGRLSLGDVILYINAIESTQQALYWIVSALADVNESILFFTSYTDLLALSQPILIPSSPRHTLSLTAEIKLCNVSFRYSDEQPWVLQNVNLSLPVGKCLALVGLNGAGKTTLVKLLTRMYDPSEGQILWDGIDIREFNPVDLRRCMGTIFQDFVRFDLSAYENIALGDINRLETNSYQTVEDLVRQAAIKAGVHEVIVGLPQGYHTVLSRWLVEDGQEVDLSGGEWQKIALARMFMRDADILILDEPTAALDAQTEYDIYSSFVELVAGKTSLLISHRFSTVRMADKIAVLEDGKISEYGSHEELLLLGGTYAKLYTMQANMYK